MRLGPGLTVVAGRNGEGKTNLLEAVYFACTGRSCRTANEREVVRFGAELTRWSWLRGRRGPPRDHGRLQAGRAEALRADGAPVDNSVGVERAAVGIGVPARPAGARPGRAGVAPLAPGPGRRRALARAGGDAPRLLRRAGAAQRAAGLDPRRPSLAGLVAGLGRRAGAPRDRADGRPRRDRRAAAPALRRARRRARPRGGGRAALPAALEGRRRGRRSRRSWPSASTPTSSAASPATARTATTSRSAARARAARLRLARPAAPRAAGAPAGRARGAGGRARRRAAAAARRRDERARRHAPRAADDAAAPRRAGRDHHDRARARAREPRTADVERGLASLAPARVLQEAVRRVQATRLAPRPASAAPSTGWPTSWSRRPCLRRSSASGRRPRGRSRRRRAGRRARRRSHRGVRQRRAGRRSST